MKTYNLTNELKLFVLFICQIKGFQAFLISYLNSKMYKMNFLFSIAMEIFNFYPYEICDT